MLRCAVGVAFALCVGVSAEAATVYDQAMSAAWLDANAQFPSTARRSVSLINSDTTLSFSSSSGSVGQDILMLVPLVDANWLIGPATVSIAIDAPAPQNGTVDNDLHIGITDGTSVVSFGRNDLINAGGRGTLVDGTFQGDHVSIMSINPLYTDAGTADSFSAQLYLSESGNVLLSGQVGSKSDSGISSMSIAPTSEFSLVVWGDDLNEEYEINSIHVQIDGSAVPEPTSLVLWSGLGVMGLIAVRRRRRVA